MIYYLYIKTHNKTGLKYLGQTQQDPYKYYGSGHYWLRHLNKHGNDISTELIAAFDNKEDLAIAGQFWSKHWNIVESKGWANLKEEVGSGGPYKFSKEQFQKLSDSHKGIKQSKETIEKRFVRLRGRIRSIKECENIKLSWAKRKEKYGKSGGNKPNITSFKKGQIPWNKGRFHTEETKEKLRKNCNIEYSKKSFICPYCNKEGKGGGMIQHHFKNCKVSQALSKST